MGKVSIQELAALLVDRAGLNKKEATTFIGAIFDLVQQALETEKIVKIKGLGTFKIIDVDDRESVNVNTGERVLIEGHGKITFAPDSIIKELVNKPFSQFDTVVLNDGVDFDDDLPPESPQNSEPVMQPVIEPVLKPVVEPVSQPIVKPASQPEPAPASVFQTKVSQEEPTEMPLVDFVDERQTEENLSESEAPSGDLPKSEAASVAFKTPEPEPEPQAAPETQPESVSDNSKEEQESQEEVEEETEEVEERFGVNKWLLALLACILGIIIGYFIGNYFPMNSNQGGEEAKVEKVVPAKKTVVTPTVTPEAVTPAENADETAEEAKQPEPEPKPEVKPEVKPEPKPEIKPEAKPAVKPEAKAAPKPVTKPEPKAPKAEEKKSAAKEPAPEKLDKYSAMDARVRTGAYRIVGTEKVVKVKEGDNLRKISNRVLGPDMECYLEVYNGMKTSTPLKVGQEIKVPKLQLKKKKKPQTVN